MGLTKITIDKKEMFNINNRNKSEIASKNKTVEQPNEKPVYFGAEYMGGHKMYPKKTDCDVRMFTNGIEIEFGRIHKNKIVIYYNTISNVTNMDEKRITKARVIGLGLTVVGLIPALLWKKRFLYTVIEYKDEVGIEHAVVIDFHRQAQKAQQVLYQNMVEAKRGGLV
jgi:hypothetical protein